MSSVPRRPSSDVTDEPLLVAARTGSDRHPSLTGRLARTAASTVAIGATTALAGRLPLWQTGLIALGVSALLWLVLEPVLVKTIRQASVPSSAFRSVAAPSGDDRAERIAARLDAPMSVLGIVFMLLVIAETVVRIDELRVPFQIASWTIWAAFVGEFGIRLAAAPSARQYLRRNWWQVLFLLVPFLRFARLIRIARVTRAGRVVSSAVRSVRSASRTLTSRLGWLLAVHVIVVLGSSQILFEFGGIVSYADALVATALAAVAGEPTGGRTAVARVMDVALAMYAAVMFAALAGVVAAFLLERRAEHRSVERRETSRSA